MIMIVFWLKFNSFEVCSQLFNWQLIIISSGNGMVLTSQQAIIWTNDDQVCRQINASSGPINLNVVESIPCITVPTYQIHVCK